jgi:RNA polymerase sigma-70 factor (sigma-E family)
VKPRGTKRSQFEQFIESHGTGLVRLAYNICGDRERAEDAAQEASVAVYMKWSRLDDPLAYARRVAVNATHDDWRRSSRQDRIGAALRQVPAPAPVSPQQLVLEHDALTTALDELPHGQRSVVVLRYWSQLSEAETAAVLELSTGTVKSQCSRALVRLREILNAQESHAQGACGA